MLYFLTSQIQVPEDLRVAYLVKCSTSQLVFVSWNFLNSKSLINVWLYFLAFATLYVRYAQVSGYIDDIRIENSYLVDKLNKAGLFLAFIICLGMSLVANFQVELRI